jgi:hypothetical protein
MSNDFLRLYGTGKTVGNMEDKRVRSTKDSTANLCSVSDHDWMKTASDNLQVCSRSDCKIVRQKIRGHWRFVGKNTNKGHNRDKETSEFREQFEQWKLEWDD